VRDQALEITEDAAADAEETNADDGNLQGGHGGMQSSSGNEPGGSAHQGDIGPDRQCSEQDGEGNHAPGAAEEGEQAGEDWMCVIGNW
jgi:hypothetical protein